MPIYYGGYALSIYTRDRLAPLASASSSSDARCETLSLLGSPPGPSGASCTGAIPEPSLITHVPCGVRPCRMALVRCGYVIPARYCGMTPVRYGGQAWWLAWWQAWWRAWWWAWWRAWCQAWWQARWRAWWLVVWRDVLSHLRVTSRDTTKLFML